MSIFSSITQRANGQTFYASWVNDIRTALISFFGAGALSEAQFTIADNISSYTDVTGLLLDKTLISAADIDYTIYRTNGAGTVRRERGVLYCTYKAVGDAWAYDRQTLSGDDALNVTDSLILTAAGQVQYKSNWIGATYVGKMRYKIVNAFNKET